MGRKWKKIWIKKEGAQSRNHVTLVTVKLLI